MGIEQTRLRTSTTHFAPSTIAYIVVFSALAIVLHIFQYPFPLAPWLKFDLAGVPLTILSLISLKLGGIGFTIFWVGSLLLTTDPTRVIGPSMKTIAEALTALPFAYIYKRSKGQQESLKTIVIGFAIALASRVLIMLLLNYIVAPYWLVWARWMKTLEDAYRFTITYLPFNALFNAIVVCYVVPIAAAIWKSVKKYILPS
ncbi:MAG: ECF transporter S component [Ignisphaera sp.]